MACENNLRQVGMALVNYKAAQRHFPEGADYNGNRFARSWLVPLLSQHEQVAVWEQSERDYTEIPFDFTWHEGFRTLIPLYQCPSDPASGQQQTTYGSLRVTLTNYLGVSGRDRTTRDGILFDDSKVRTAEIHDGLSNTLMVGERPPSTDFWYGWWYAGMGQDADASGEVVLGVRELKAPQAARLEGCEVGPYEFGPGSNQQCDTLHFWSYHKGGGHFVRADGSTQFFAYAGKDVLPALATIHGGEIVNSSAGQ